MTTLSDAPAREAVLLQVRGVVQGVGFRPFVHRLALRHALDGWVRNEPGAVRIRVSGDPDDVRGFLAELQADAPPLARIDAIELSDADELDAEPGFRVLASETKTAGTLPVSPDVAICEACRAELADPANRRHRYPFITCTDCGPRFTVIERMPYDRERTSMRAFTQCADCLAEYTTPTSRRYHSETNSCPKCGPRLWITSADGRRLASGDAAIRLAAKRLLKGQIVALRGVGGFHLAVDATNEAAVQRLRQRKRREGKPLAVMVRTLAEAEKLGRANLTERELLASPERPVVLLRTWSGAGLAPSVTPGLDRVGVMLAYTPLHHLLLGEVGRPLVMTSGNLSEEPICTGNDEALERLGKIADLLLLHDREIVARYDDSVVRVVDDAPVFLRRSRGYAPLPLELPVDAPAPILAVGPHLKNTFTLAQGGTAYVSQHVGDLENLETLEHFRASLDRFRALFRVDPEVAARDLHPGYLSTRLAEETGFARVIPIQHHHAHVAAVMAEHGVTSRVIGVAFDGTGYGDDGNVWGAEILVADLASYRRAGHL
ncbi:MAG TPA: carbamoyltransferase HypF, partial [Longimicrobiaceae bacterium]